MCVRGSPCPSITLTLFFQFAFLPVLFVYRFHAVIAQHQSLCIICTTGCLCSSYLNWATAATYSLLSKAREQTQRQTWFWIINVPPRVELEPLPHSVPSYTPGVSLHGSWCKAPLINLPKLVCVCVLAQVCASMLKHILQAGRQVTTKTSQSASWLKCQWCMAKRAQEWVAPKRKKMRNETQGRERKYTKHELR